MASKEKEKDDTRRKDKEVAAGDVTVATKTAALRKERVEDKSEHVKDEVTVTSTSFSTLYGQTGHTSRKTD